MIFYKTNGLLFILLEENDFLWKITFLGCLSSWILNCLPELSEFSLLTSKFLAQACELNYPFAASWKPRPYLMEEDIWPLRGLCNILELSWNLNFLFFTANLPSRILNSTSFFPFVFSSWVLNLMIYPLNSFSFSSNIWSISSYIFFYFSKSDLREIIFASSPSQ